MLYLLVVGGGGVVLLLIVAVIVLLAVCCKLRNRRGGHDLRHPVPESTAATNTQESTFTEEEPASRNVDVDGVESLLESVSHHLTIATITHEVYE